MTVQNIVEDIQRHAWVCPGCSNSYTGAPLKGVYFDVEHLMHDDNGDLFVIDSDTKVIKGTETYTCPYVRDNGDGTHCTFQLDEVTWIDCKGYKCEGCGVNCHYDNEHCRAHEYSPGDKADGYARKFVVANCKCDTKPAEPVTPTDEQKPADQFVVGSQWTINTNGADGANVKVGEKVQVIRQDHPWLAIQSLDNGRTWNMSREYLDPLLPEEIANKFVKKDSEKKVHVIEF